MANIGRVSTYSQEIADEICQRLSHGEPLAHICRDEHMPAVRTVSAWKAAHESFAASFAHAREDGYDQIASDCLDIADDTSEDTILTDTGYRPNAEWISRSRLRIETRLKLLARWDPKRYGDRQAIDLTDHTPKTPEQVNTRIAELLALAQSKPDDS